MEAYNNEQLAIDYLKIRIIRKSNIAYFVVKEAIRTAPVNIPEYFAEHKSLKELRVPGIGRQTSRLLELILKEGPEKARIQLTKEADEERGQDRFTGLRLIETDQYPPGVGRYINRKPILED